jgi:hypothetical protein
MKRFIPLILFLALISIAATNAQVGRVPQPLATLPQAQHVMRPAVMNWAPVIPPVMAPFLWPVYRLFSIKIGPICTPATCIPNPVLPHNWLSNGPIQQ